MSYELKEEYINNILQYQKEIPIPIVKLANSFNIEVYKVSDMKSDISGAIINENGIYTIYTNKNELEYRRRFTIAHELSHFMLHKDIINNHLNGNLTDAKENGGIMYRSKLSNIFEKDANKLAAEILMPLEKVTELYFNCKNIKKLAKEFMVSEQAMAIRIDNPYNLFLKKGE